MICTNLSIRRICLTKQHKLIKLEPRQNCAFVFSIFLWFDSFDYPPNFMKRGGRFYCLFRSILFLKSLCIPRRSQKRKSLCCLSLSWEAILNRTVSFSFPRKKWNTTTWALFKRNHVEASYVGFLVICNIFLFLFLTGQPNKSAFVKFIPAVCISALFFDKIHLQRPGLNL